MKGRTHQRISTSTPSGIENLERRLLLVAQPEIEILYQGCIIAKNDTTPSPADGTDFGDVNIARQSVQREFTIRNAGTGTLNLGTVWFDGDPAATWSIAYFPVTTLAAGESTSFAVIFDPETVLDQNIWLVVDSNDAGDPHYGFELNGRGVATPDMAMFAGGYELTSETEPSASMGTDFGSVDLKEFRVHNFVIVNYGLGLLTFVNPDYEITGAGASQFHVIGLNDHSIDTNAHEQFQVEFDPTVEGVHDATFTVYTNDPAHPSLSVALRGTATSYVDIEMQGGQGIIPDGRTYASIIDDTDWQDVDVGQAQTRTFRVKNIGSGTLHVTGASVSEGSGDFGIVTQPAAGVGAGDYTTIEVRFAPSGYGSKTATISITSDDADESPYTFAVGGVGLQPDVSVRGQGGTILNGDTTPATADGSDFGSALVGSSVYRAFDIRNDGTSELELTVTTPPSPIEISGANASDFTLFQNVTNVSVPAGGFQAFILRFTPSAPGLRTATITFRSDDPDENPYTFKVQGTAVAVGEPEIAVVYDGTTIADGDTTPSAGDGTDFGALDTRDGAPVTRSFTVFNLGAGPLNNLLATLTGGYGTDWSITQQLPTDVAGIPAGEFRTLSITFDPSIPGTRTPLLSIRSNDADENPYEITLSGTGTQCQNIAVKGQSAADHNTWVLIPAGDTAPLVDDSTDWGSLNCGAELSRAFRIASTGSTSLHLATAAVEIVGPDAGDFVLTQPTSRLVNTSVDFWVKFKPLRDGLRQATVIVHSEDPDEPAYSFTIQGTGAGVADIDVRSGNPITDGSTTPQTANNTDFGSADLGSPITKRFYIKNVNYGGLNLADDPVVSISGANAGDFAVTAAPSTAGPLYKDQQTYFDVTFTPSGDGVRAATISIASNDPDESPFDFAIRGTGVTYPVMEIQGNDVVIADNDSTPSGTDFTSFGSADIRDGAVTRTFYIYNRGGDTLTLTGATPVVVSGAGAAAFSVVTQPLTSIPPGQYTAFHVRFNPSNAGAANAALSIATNDTARNPYNFSISGTGTATPEMDVTGNGVSIADGEAAPSAGDFTDFGSGLVGTPITRSFTIANSGSGPLNLTGSPRVKLEGANAADFSVSTAAASSVSANGGTTLFQITFTPSANGARAATVVINNNDSDEGPYSFDIKGTGSIEPEAEIRGNNVIIVDGDDSPAAADYTDFGSTDWIAGEVVRTFTLYNRGSQPLNLLGPKVAMGGAAGGDFIVTPPAAASVDAGGSVTFQVSFEPTVVGTRDAVVTVYTNDTDEGDYTFSVRGTATSAPEIAISGNSQLIADGDTSPTNADGTDFGGTDIAGGAISRTFVINNLGSGELALTSTPLVKITGPAAADFSVTTLPAASVAHGEFTSFTIRFDPSVSGVRAATISIDNNDGDENPYNFSVTGLGSTNVEIDVQGNGNSIADGDGSPSASDYTDFGSVLIGAGTLVRTFTIANTGSGALTLTGTPKVVIQGQNAADFAVTTQPGGSVAGGGATTFVVRFTPSAGGVRTATLSIANSDGDENPYDFSIAATALAAPEAEVRVNNVVISDGDATPALADHTDFGAVDFASGTITRTFTLYNVGSADLNLTDPRVRITGVNAGDFTLGALPGTPIAPGASSSFQVTFDPAAVGDRIATVTVLSDDGNEAEYDFAIKGAGTSAPEMDVEAKGAAVADGSAAANAANDTDFGSVELSAGAVSHTFTIYNRGSAGVNLTGQPKVRIAGSGAADFTVTSQPGSSVAPGENTTFTIRFDPVAAGVRNATVTIENNDGNEGSYDFVITGTATAGAEIDVRGNGVGIPDGDLSPSAADGTDFGAKLLGTGTVTRTFTIANTGSGPLSLTGSPAISIVGDDADFVVTIQPDSTIPASNSLTFEIAFTPTAEGLRTATVVILSNDGNETPYEFGIAGHGTVPQVPEIAIFGADQAIANGDAAPDVADGTDFGTAAFEGGSVSHTFLVCNTGNRALTITGATRVQLTNTTDFEVVSSLGGTIAAGGQSSVEILFHPATPGPKTSQVIITSDDGDETPYIFVIQGNGSGIAADRFEYNDDRFSAKELGLLGNRVEANLTIDEADDEDWFAFQAEAGGQATFVADRTDTIVELWDAGGGLLATSSVVGGQQSLAYAVTLGTRYYVRIDPEPSAVNEFYSLSLDVPTSLGHEIVAGGYSFTDQNGDEVTVKLVGGGTGKVYLLDDAAAQSDMHRIELANTGFTSKLSIEVTKAGSGDGRTNVTNIIVHPGSLQSISAPAVNLLGNVLIDGSLQTLTLGDATAAFKQIRLCNDPTTPLDPKAKLQVTMGEVRDVTLDTGSVGVASLTALQWLETDTVPDRITAPFIDKLNITGRPMGGGLLMLEGNFQANIFVGSPGAKAKAPLGEVSIAGMLGHAQIDVQGYDGTGQSIKKLTVASTLTPTVRADGGIGTIITNDWTGGSISAGWIGTITSTGNTHGKAGRLGMDLALTGEHAAAGKATLGTVATSGNWMPSLWDIRAGFVSAITVGGLTDGAQLQVQGFDAKGQSVGKLQLAKADGASVVTAGGIRTLNANEWLNGDLTAGWIGTLSTTASHALGTDGDFGGAVTLTSANVRPKTATLAKASIAGDLLAGSIWKLPNGYVGDISILGTASNSSLVIRGQDGQGKSVNKLSVALAQGLSLAVDAGIASLNTNGYSDGQITAGWIGSFKATANAAIAAPGNVATPVTLSGAGVPAHKNTLDSVSIAGDLKDCQWEILAGTVGSMTVSGKFGGMLFRSAGNVSSLTVGSLEQSRLGVGVSLSQLQLNDHVVLGDLANAPTGTIKTFSIVGLKGQTGPAAPRFFIQSYVSAGIATMNVLNWDGSGGLWAPAGKMGKVTHTDSVTKSQSWAWPAPKRQNSSGPEDFIHII